LGQPVSPFFSGSGLADLGAAAQADVTAEPDYRWLRTDT
jgi:hypothetical protein